MLGRQSLRPRKPDIDCAGQIQKKFWVTLVICALFCVAYENPDPAYAAGEVITVEPATVTPGQEVTITISNIVASSFCDYLPYAGFGYTATAYMRTLGNDYHQFFNESPPFDPGSDDEVSFKVQIPFNFPQGRTSITGDCWAPNGMQTGNTANPFIIEVVNQLPEAEVPLDTAASDDVDSSDSVNDDGSAVDPAPENEEAVQSGESGIGFQRGAQSSPTSLDFVLRDSIEVESLSILTLRGQNLSAAGEVELTLRSQEIMQALPPLKIDGSEFEQVILLPGGLSDGEYDLIAQGDSEYDASTVRAEISIVVSDGIAKASDTGQELQSRTEIPLWVSATLTTATAAGLILIVFSILMVLKNRRTERFRRLYESGAA